jgi:transcriptional regulator with PAS, ATPase and Fis domain
MKTKQVSLPEMQTAQLGLPDYMDSVESFVIEQALEETKNNHSQAAILLRIPRPTLLNKMRNSIRLAHKIGKRLGPPGPVQ